MAKVTMQDIADKLNVSVVTISKALSNKPGVSDELKEKIIDLADEMGYRYNTSASAMKLGLSSNIGVIIAERYTGGYDDFYLTVFQYLTKALDEYKYTSMLHILKEEDEEKLVLPRSYSERKTDGFIVLGQVSKEYIECLQESDVPILFLDFYEEHSEVDSINADNFYAAYKITNFLIKYNHKKIAFVGNIHATSSIQDRYLGFYKSIIEHRLVLPNDYVVSDRDAKGRFIPFELPKEMPTAFVCNCDQVAFNLIEQLKEEGYRIPEDVSVVGFDNDIFSRISKPQITTVDVNLIEMTTIAATTMIDKINQSDKKIGRVLIEGKIVYKDSVSRL